ncbi:MAG: hypothetical protein Q8O76_08520, partial [Chloroflexota bacterium]|nr:hypothetical protein [Chloroflexota bacterium]
MARYIIRTKPGQAISVKATLPSIGIKPIDSSLDFIFVDIPADKVAAIEALPGVIKVTPDRKVGIAAVMPVETKVQEFYKRMKSPFGLPKAL